MNSLSLIRLTTLLTLSLSTLSYAQSGAGGSYASTTGKRYLEKSAALLSLEIPNSESDYLKEDPSRKAVFLTALKNITPLPLERRYRDGDELLLDFDQKTTSIIILKRFFEVFDAATSEDQSIPKVKVLLAHEASHLWGFGEAFASDFEKDFAEPFSAIRTLTREEIEELILSASKKKSSSIPLLTGAEQLDLQFSANSNCKYVISLYGSQNNSILDTLSGSQSGIIHFDQKYENLDGVYVVDIVCRDSMGLLTSTASVTATLTQANGSRYSTKTPISGIGRSIYFNTHLHFVYPEGAISLSAPPSPVDAALARKLLHARQIVAVINYHLATYVTGYRDPAKHQQYTVDSLFEEVRLEKMSGHRICEFAEQKARADYSKEFMDSDAEASFRHSILNTYRMNPSMCSN